MVSQPLPRLRLELDFMPSPVEDRPGLLIRDPYQFSNLQVMAVRNGEIASLRDYWNPLDRPELAALAGG